MGHPVDLPNCTVAFSFRRKLDKNKMIRFDERTGYLHATDLGRTASQFYIKWETIETFNEMMKPVMKEDEILDMLSRAQASHFSTSD